MLQSIHCRNNSVCEQLEEFINKLRNWIQFVHHDYNGLENNTDLSQILLNLLLAKVISPLGAALGEGLLLALGPVLVEPSLGFLSDMFSPDSLESSHTTWSLDISNNSNAHHRGSLNDGDRLHHLLLVDLGARSVHFPHDVSHAGLVSQEGSQVDRLAGVILGEGLDLASVPLGSLLG